MKYLLLAWLVIILVLILFNSCRFESEHDFTIEKSSEIRVNLDSLYDSYKQTFNEFISHDNVDSALVYLGKMSAVSDSRRIVVKAFE